MPIRFMHLADIHLGYEQYGLSQRYNDFYQSFERAISDALAEGVDFVIIAGDLFHQRTIGPQTLLQAAHELDRLRQAGIPCLVVMGNHERAHYRERLSWLDYLDGRGLLTVLSARYDKEGALQVTPRGEDGGTYVDIGPARIYGLPYAGSTTPRLIADFAAHLAQTDRGRRPAFTILVAHAGLEGVLPNFTAHLTFEQLAPLRPYIDYVAMGHVHKRFEREAWVYNPGSLEPVSLTEADERGGGYLVEVSANGVPARVQHRTYYRRPFVRLPIKISGCERPEQIYDVVERRLAEQLAGPIPPFSEPPIVDVSLECILQFDKQAIDMDHLQSMIKTALKPLWTRVRLLATAADLHADELTGALNRAELEHQVLTSLLAGDGRYRERAGDWAQLLAETKRLALEKSDPSIILDHLRAGIGRIGGGAGQGRDANHSR